MVEIRNS